MRMLRVATESQDLHAASLARLHIDPLPGFQAHHAQHRHLRLSRLKRDVLTFFEHQQCACGNAEIYPMRRGAGASAAGMAAKIATPALLTPSGRRTPISIDNTWIG